jgi:hypothetical protein
LHTTTQSWPQTARRATYAPAFKAMSERLRIVEANQRARRFEIITEQALASYWGDELDTATRELGIEALLVARNDRESPRFTRYFKNTVTL